MNSRWISRSDSGCKVVITKDWVEETKQHCNCDGCEYKKYAHSCMSQILDAFTKPIIDKYQELRKDLSPEYINAHYTELFPSMK